MSTHANARANLTEEERQNLLQFLLQRLQDGELARGALAAASKQFNVHRSTISRIWAAAHASRVGDIWTVTSGKKKNGASLKYDREALREEVKDLPLHSRTSVRALSENLKISVGTLHTMIRKDGVLRPHSSSVKPSLTEENKLHRVHFCLEQRDGMLYEEMYDRIHVDEKWFNLTQVKSKFYLAAGEEPPNRSTRHKSHIPKVMFLAAVARPHWDPVENREWDGKIGIWPVGRIVLAQRSSRNRPRGTPEWKNESLTKQVYTRMFRELVIPAIIEKWPHDRNRRCIRIQQDNAPGHFSNVEFDELLEGFNTRGLQIGMYCQPPNSPDLNILDLGFFASLQSMVYKVPSQNCDAMIETVKEKFAVYPPYKLRNVFLTLQNVMNSIIEVNGGNDYDIQHMGKQTLERHGLLPTSLRVTEYAQEWDNNSDDEDDNNDSSDSSDDPMENHDT